MELIKQIEAGTSGLDIIHGELKNLMLECETDLALVSELQDLPDHKYLSGKLDALVSIYKLTYQLAFAINERNSNGHTAV